MGFALSTISEPRFAGRPHVHAASQPGIIYVLFSDDHQRFPATQST
jgi:hypothetical protein